MPKIDVLLPVTGPAPGLRQAIASLAWQEHDDLRVIRVDDDADPARALRAGLAACTAPYVACMGVELCCHPERLARQLAALEARADAVSCACRARLVDADGLLTRQDREPASGSAFPRQAMLLRREAAMRWRAILEGSADAVADPWQPLSALGPIARVDEALVAIRADEGDLEGHAHTVPGAARHRRPGRALGGAFRSRPQVQPPTLAVLIPARDMEVTLRATLDSVAEQTRIPDEVIVVDDGSRDGTRAIARRHAAVSRVVAGPERGLAAARNAGIAVCTSEVVVPCDADDLLEPDWLARVAGVFARHPHVDVVAGRNLSIDEDGTRLLLSPPPPGPWDAAALSRRNTMSAPSGTALRVATLRALGGYDERVRFGEDWELWQRLASTSAAVLCDAPAARIRLRRGSMVRSADAEQTLAPRLERLPPDAGADARARVHLGVARVLLAHGVRGRAAALAMAALREDPSLATLRTALPTCVGAALPTSAFEALFEARRQLRRAGGRLLDALLPAPLGRAP